MKDAVSINLNFHFKSCNNTIYLLQDKNERCSFNLLRTLYFLEIKFWVLKTNFISLLNQINI